MRSRQRGRFGLRQLLGDRPRPHPDRAAAGRRKGHPGPRRHAQLQGLRRRKRAVHVSLEFSEAMPIFFTASKRYLNINASFSQAIVQQYIEKLNC